MRMVERRPRRRRRLDKIDATERAREPGFDSALWAADAISLLDHVRDADVPQNRKRWEQRWRTRRYINAIQHILGEHPAFAEHKSCFTDLGMPLSLCAG